jgi:hypothetical protein
MIYIFIVHETEIIKIKPILPNFGGKCGRESLSYLNRKIKLFLM